jgi:EAL domain-containing protein (putative c-di-GMP-specific phosphodiesterase class I)
MYRAKATRRGGVELFDERLRASVVERLDLTNDLIAGIPAGQLVVHYQPEVALVGDVVWAEALVRWQHPERGLLTPDAFIDLAEETGLIVPIGQHVLAEAVRQMTEWSRLPPGRAPTAVSVNISARQLVEGDLVQLTTDLLAGAGLDPSRLWFELTETTLLKEPERAIATFHELKGLGVGLSIDDFGTGYSSLAYARLLPIDALKIDRSFVGGVQRDLRDEAVVRACIALARSFGVLAIAEGVETEEQLEELARLGCDMAQGYVLARPGTASEIEAWVEARGRALG